MDRQGPQRNSIQEAARNLLSLLNNQLQEDQTTPQQQLMAPAGSSTVQQEMTRSFPGFFLKATARGRKRFHSPCKVVATSSKNIAFQFYLLNENLERTPTPRTKLTLLLAGMGRRTVTLPESADHFELSRLLTCQYPKLESLSGGWLLCKALGGSGQRKLIVIPPESEGYNAAYLKNVTAGAKNTLYIIPLQDKLDTSRLPSDAQEFQKMPKATCKACRSTMPLQVLALHVKSCVDHESSEDGFDVRGRVNSSPEVTIVDEVISTASMPGTSDADLPNTTIRPNLGACPVCQMEYPLDYLHIHASSCGDSVMEIPSSVKDASKSNAMKIENLDDVIQAIRDGVSKDGKTFDIAVSRQNMLERGLVQWQRQKKASPTNQLKVSFLGEAGIDTGALRKEFLTVMMAAIEKRFFHKGTHGSSPYYSVCDLDKGYFRTVGEIMAVSLAQDGPPPNFLMSWCYSFLCSGSLDTDVDRRDVCDDQYNDVISRVEAATEVTIQDLTDEILTCGYTGIITFEKKNEIVRAVVLHAHLRLLPILCHIKDGLSLYGLNDIMAKYPLICEPLFVPGSEMIADADFIISVCQAEYSERGSNKEQVEVTLMNHLQDFLQELEQDETGPGKREAAYAEISPKAFLQWVTGQGHVPVLQEEKESLKVTVKFDHDCQMHFGEHKICYPTVAACSSTITLPVQHMITYQDFKVVLMEAFYQGQEFLMV